MGMKNLTMNCPASHFANLAANFPGNCLENYCAPSVPSGAAILLLRGATFPVASAAQSFERCYCAAAAQVLPGGALTDRAFAALRRYPCRAGRLSPRSARSRTDFFRYRVRDQRDSRDLGPPRLPNLPPHRRRQTLLESGGTWLRRAASVEALSARREEPPAISAAAISPTPDPWLRLPHSCPSQNR